MRDFDFESPQTVAEAVDLLSRYNGSAKVLAGGTDLIDQIRNGRFTPKVVVDLKKIPDVNALECGPSGLRLGASVPCYKIYRHPEIARLYTALFDSVHIIGGIQIQSRASVGGNLCNSSPAADSTPSLIALGGTVVIAGPGGTREAPVESFCTGPGRNILQGGEFVVEIRFPPPAPPCGSSYLRFIPRNEMDIAVVGVGAAVTLDSSRSKILSARIGLGAVAPTPLLAADAAAALIGQPIGDAALEAAANAARSICSPIDDMRGTREFRIHVTGVLVKRAVSIAIERARKS